MIGQDDVLGFPIPAWIAGAAYVAGWVFLDRLPSSRHVLAIGDGEQTASMMGLSLCLLQAVFDKSAWLREREINELWPVAGLPETLHADNGADFRSRAFVRGCQDAGIKIIWRPPGEPHFGGHIERLIGTQMGSLHLLPGSTFSNTEERGEYDPKRHAALTLRDLERYIALDIVGVSRSQSQAAIMCAPSATQ